MSKAQRIIIAGVAAAGVLSLASCANTIRGVGRDAANTVNATQAAGNDVARSAN
ncbi:entericidin domain-containing protein [Rhizobium sp. PAMB 3182]|jgi:entericidin B